jgi:tagaturonate reductase
MARIDQVIPRKERRETVIQFGSGRFLRGFFDWMLQKANDAGVCDGAVAVVQSTGRGACDLLTAQRGQYTHIARGREGIEVTPVDVIARCVKVYEDFEGFLKLAENADARFIVSNTTEAGICYAHGQRLSDPPPESFPARLTALMYRRFQRGLGGFVLLPCELIEHNGEALKRLVVRHAREWGLEEAFLRFVEEENRFCDTLVDRIVTGFPADEAPDLGYEDALIDASEPYHLWAIQGAGACAAELPLDRAGLNVLWTDDLTPFRLRKVRILNGAHTAAVAPAMLGGIPTVGEAMRDPAMGTFLRRAVLEEILPTLDMPREELTAYAGDVFKRFSNPWIHHEWRAISLNSVSKFRVRVLPSILEYERRFGFPPARLTFSLAKLIELYRAEDIQDDARVAAAMRRASVREILSDTALWGADIAHLTGAVEARIGSTWEE